MAHELISDLSDSELDAVAAGNKHGWGPLVDIDISKSFNNQVNQAIISDVLAKKVNVSQGNSIS